MNSLFDISDPAFITTVATSCASVSAAIVSIIKAVQAAKRAEKAQRILDDARSRQTYFECPECGKKITLDRVSFHLPGGALDNDLNGVPDEKEGD